MAGWKSSWNSLAVRLMLSFTLYVVAVTAVFTISPTPSSGTRWRRGSPDAGRRG